VQAQVDGRHAVEAQGGFVATGDERRIDRLGQMRMQHQLFVAA
jgi:hypothetical protein